MIISSTCTTHHCEQRLESWEFCVSKSSRLPFGTKPPTPVLLKRFACSVLPVRREQRTSGPLSERLHHSAGPLSVHELFKRQALTNHGPGLWKTPPIATGNSSKRSFCGARCHQAFVCAHTHTHTDTRFVSMWRWAAEVSWGDAAAQGWRQTLAVGRLLWFFVFFLLKCLTGWVFFGRLVASHGNLANKQKTLRGYFYGDVKNSTIYFSFFFNSTFILNVIPISFRKKSK